MTPYVRTITCAHCGHVFIAMAHKKLCKPSCVRVA